jgi:hypothetical protein
VTDGAYESQRGTFTIAARPKVVNVTTTLQNNYIAQFEDTNACKYATDGNNTIVAIGGPLLQPNGTSIAKSDYQVRYSLINGTYGNIPELYYQGNLVKTSTGATFALQKLMIAGTDSYLDTINGQLSDLGFPYFTLRSPANILVSTDKGKHFKPIKDGTSPNQDKSLCVYSFRRLQ